MERHLAKFFFGMFAVMLIAFVLPKSQGPRCGARGRLYRCLGLDAGRPVHARASGGTMANYQHELGAYFNEPAVFKPSVPLSGPALHPRRHRRAAVAMRGSSSVVAKLRAFTLVLPLVPALLPIFFVGFCAAWLWHFGHHLHPMGAFTLKPFMPTVCSVRAKVAQFSTFSYPYWGYAMLVAASLALPAFPSPQTDARAVE